MPIGPNLAETPRFSRIRKFSETFVYILLLFFIFPLSLRNDEYDFRNYIEKFNKSYENETIYKLRFKAFMESLKSIEILNNGSNGSAIYGLTKYSDMFPKEFFASNLIVKLPEYTSETYNHNSSSNMKRRSLVQIIPDKLDLRDKNAVSEVQNQGVCGACWAFSVIGVIETVNALKTGNLTRLSIQQMIDCSVYNYGCTGGDTCTLLRWLKSFNIKIVYEHNYPLTLESQNCKNTEGFDGVRVEDFGCNNFVNQEDLMLYLLANSGPLAVSINAKSWQHYVGGIVQYHCNSDASNLNHAVQIVGYDLTADVPHYIIKNSWGRDFGHYGYLYIAIGNNICGLAHQVSSVKVL